MKYNKNIQNRVFQEKIFKTNNIENAIKVNHSMLSLVGTCVGSNKC